MMVATTRETSRKEKALVLKPDDLTPDQRAITASRAATGLVVVPFATNAEGDELLGTAAFLSRGEQSFNPRDLTVVGRAVGDRRPDLAGSGRQAHAMQELEVWEAVAAASEQGALEETIDAALAAAAKRVSADGLALALFEPERSTAVLVAQWGNASPFPVGEQFDRTALAGDLNTLTQGKTVTLNNIPTLTDSDMTNRGPILDIGVHSMVVAPLMSRGRLLGSLTAARSNTLT